LNLNISASRQNIINLVGNFQAIHVGNMPANFQASSFTGVGGEWGDKRTRDFTPHPYTKYQTPPSLCSWGMGKMIRDNGSWPEPVHTSDPQ